jgi:co-chaperonin GroES (HSP10)
VDDLISFAKGSGKPLKDPYTGEEFLVINDQDVVCVFKKEE